MCARTRTFQKVRSIDTRSNVAYRSTLLNARINIGVGIRVCACTRTFQKVRSLDTRSRVAYRRTLRNARSI